MGVERPDENMPSALDRNPWPQGFSPGAARAVGQLLDDFRPYLLTIAMGEMPDRLRGKVGASDLVQETILKGFENYGDFQGLTRDELARWLRAILINHIANWQKAYRSQKRDLTLEVPVDSRIAFAIQPSPSSQALAREQSIAVEQAISRLPDEQRRAILMRHRENLTFAEIGARMGKTAEAVCKIWARAVKRLQQELHGNDSIE